MNISCRWLRQSSPDTSREITSKCQTPDEYMNIECAMNRGLEVNAESFRKVLYKNTYVFTN